MSGHMHMHGEWPCFKKLAECCPDGGCGKAKCHGCRGHADTDCRKCALKERLTEAIQAWRGTGQPRGIWLAPWEANLLGLEVGDKFEGVDVKISGVGL